MEKPFLLSAEAVLKPKNGGKSFLEEGVEITAHTLKTFWADQHALKDIVSQFKNIGFSVSTITKTGFFFSGATSLFEEKFAAEGEKMEIVFDGVQNINKLTNNPFLTISPTLFNGNILSILISSPSVPAEFNPTTQIGWPENEEQWNQQKQIAIENHQTQLWELPRLLGAEPKTNEKHVEDINYYGDWPYQYSGFDVNVHVLDTGLTQTHPFFKAAFPSNIFIKDGFEYNDYPLELQYKENYYHEWDGSPMKHLFEFVLKIQDSKNIENVESLINMIDNLKSDDNIIHKRKIEFQIKVSISFKKEKFENFKNEIKGIVKKAVEEQNRIYYDFLNGYNTFTENLKDRKNIVIQIIKQYFDDLTKEHEKRKALILKMSKLESKPHGTTITANLLSVAPHINLIFHKIETSVERDDGYLFAQIDLPLKECLENLKTKERDSKQTYIVNYSYSFTNCKESILNSLENSNALLIVAAGNFGANYVVNQEGKGEYKRPIYSNFQINSNHVIQVGGAFFEVNDSGKKTLNYSSGAVGFKREEFGGISHYPPDICSLDGGFFKSPNMDPKDLGYRQIFPKGKAYSNNYSIWGPCVHKIDFDMKTANVQKYKEIFNFQRSTGTSLSAPQISGVCAIVLEICKNATPGLVKFIIKNAGDEIKYGRSANNIDAFQMNDDAGNSTKFININKAVKLATFLNNNIQLKRIKQKKINEMNVKWHFNNATGQLYPEVI